jgi:hypothetical protein
MLEVSRVCGAINVSAQRKLRCRASADRYMKGSATPRSRSYEWAIGISSVMLVALQIIKAIATLYLQQGGESHHSLAGSACLFDARNMFTGSQIECLSNEAQCTRS